MNPGHGRGFLLVSPSSPVLGKKRVDPAVFLLAEAEIESRCQTVDLFRTTSAHDRCADSGVMQRPRHCYDSRADLVPAPNLTQELYQPQVAAQTRLLELDRSPAPVIGRK